MYRPAYRPPILGFIFPETSAAQLMYFLEENAEVCSIFLYKNRNARSNYVSLLTILYTFILFYVLLYIIVIVIIYLTDTYIYKKTISHVLLTYKNNFLTIKSWIFYIKATKIRVIVYKSLVRFKDQCNNKALII